MLDLSCPLVYVIEWVYEIQIEIIQQSLFYPSSMRTFAPPHHTERTGGFWEFVNRVIMVVCFSFSSVRIFLSGEWLKKIFWLVRLLLRMDSVLHLFSHSYLCTLLFLGLRIFSLCCVWDFYGSYLWIVMCFEEEHTVKNSLHLLHHIVVSNSSLHGKSVWPCSCKTYIVLPDFIAPDFI